jgi:hypothetical protein
MTICEFCLQYRQDGKCGYGLDLPKRMGCREFDPGVERFCADPTDFTSASQIIQMATFFGIKGMELKKVRVVAAEAERARSSAASNQPVPNLSTE